MWHIPFREAAELGFRVAVCDRRGRLLAAANIDGHLITKVEAIMGENWHEFVDELDLDWFNRDDESEPTSYIQLGRIDGKPARQLITLVKRSCGDAWICYGSVLPMPHAQLPRQLELP